MDLRLAAWPAILLTDPEYNEYVLVRNHRNFIKFPFFFRHVRAIFANERGRILASSTTPDGSGFSRSAAGWIRRSKPGRIWRVTYDGDRIDDLVS